VAAIEAAAGHSAITVGKPSHWLISRLIAKFNLTPERTVIIGDRLDTDIMLGSVGGTGSILVCTGCVGFEEVKGLRAGEKGTPTYVLSHVGKMVVDGEGGDRSGQGAS
jgi:phosphoglycolate phosphatase